MTGVFLMILSQSLRLSAIIALLVLFRILFRRIPGRSMYFLWLTVFLGLICPFTFKFSYGVSDLAIMEKLSETRETAVMEEIGSTESSTETAAALPAPENHPEPVSGTDHSELFLSAAAAVWAAVAVLLLAVNVWKLAGFMKRLQGARDLGGGVFETDAIDVPLVAGYLHPRIYIPSFLPQAERVYILEHERTHLRRKDHIVKLAVFAVTLLHWFNPLVWAAYYFLSEDMERACDEAVIRSMGKRIKKAYSMSLLSLSADGRGRYFPMVTFTERRIKYRVMNILRYRKPGFLTIQITVIMFAVTACSSFTEPQPAADSASSAGQEQVEAEEEAGQPDEQAEGGQLEDSEIETFFRQFQQAVASDDQETVAGLFRYPKELVLPGQDKGYLYSAEEFLTVYEEIFTEDFKAQIAALDPGEFTSDPVSGISWGQGNVWAREYDGSLNLISVFPSRTDRYVAYYEGNDAAASDPEEDPMYQVNGIREAEAREFAAQTAALAAEDRREELAVMIQYPVILKADGTEKTLNNPEEFLENYDSVFTEEFTQKLSELSAQPLNYRYDGTFLGNGELWMTLVDGELKILSLFPSDSVQMTPAGGGEITPGP